MARLPRRPRRGSVGAALLVVVALKVVAAALPLLAMRRGTSPAWARRLRVLAWVEAAVLTLYGLVLTTVGVLVQTGAISVAATADHRALAWHAFLWDPWFLLWGLLVIAALVRSRRARARAKDIDPNTCLGRVPTG